MRVDLALAGLSSVLVGNACAATQSAHETCAPLCDRGGATRAWVLEVVVVGGLDHAPPPRLGDPVTGAGQVTGDEVAPTSNARAAPPLEVDYSDPRAPRAREVSVPGGGRALAALSALSGPQSLAVLGGPVALWVIADGAPVCVATGDPARCHWVADPTATYDLVVRNLGPYRTDLTLLAR